MPTITSNTNYLSEINLECFFEKKLLLYDSFIIPINAHSVVDSFYLQALDISLTPEEVKTLHDLVPAGAISGERYPDSFASSKDN